MSDRPQLSLTRHLHWLFRPSLGLLLAAVAPSLFAQAPTPPAPPAQQTGASQPAAQSDQKAAQNASTGAELSSRDTAPTFRVRVNLVLVRVVVRDSQGRVISGLKKEDFQLFDNRKPQIISTFSVETPESHILASTTSTDDKEVAASVEPGKAIASLPQRFVSVVFDDQHLGMDDAMFVKQAANKFLDSVAASDRVGFYSTSGQFTQEFTQDHDSLRKALLQLLPRSPTQGIHDCPEINYYEADLIQNKQDPQALAVATEDAVQCAFQGDESQRPAAQAMAQAMAGVVLGREDSSTEYALRHMEEVLRRLSSMPGQRILVFLSPGFLSTTLYPEFSDIIERATKGNIVVNTIDARGLYTPDVAGDIADPPRNSALTAGPMALYRVSAQIAQDEVLQEFADGTGGTFFHNRNDIDEGLREAGAAPAVTYLLGFSPQNLKLDGRMHVLKVSFAHKSNYKIQARHAYFAPRHVADPAEQAKQEIQEAIFSQDEIRDLPADLHTQFFKPTANEARLAVLTHVDIKGMRFVKAGERNDDNLTVATAIFDDNGNYITGGEKIIEMKLRDTTYDRLLQSGLNLKSSFDVKPGTYLVRQVVRDSQGEQLSAHNGAVVIPY